MQPESARATRSSRSSSRACRTCRSRARRFDWGIKVPWDESHVIYVWFDALLNYATAVGYGSDHEEFARRWPAYHLVGKDILRFHAVIWPAMLMAAGLRCRAGSSAHGWLLVGGEKMSKSKLTGIAPSRSPTPSASDAFRYYFLRAIAFGQDGSFSLGGPVGPLPGRARQRLRQPRLARRSRWSTRYFDGRACPRRGRVHRGRSRRSSRRCADAAAAADAAIERLAHPRGDRRDLDDRRRAQRLHHRAGAVGAREGRRASATRLGTVLYTAAEGLRALAVLLSPVMPEGDRRSCGSRSGAEALGPLAEQPIRDAGALGHAARRERRSSALAPLFPRIEQTRRVDASRDDRAYVRERHDDGKRDVRWPAAARAARRAGLRQPHAPRDRRRRRAARLLDEQLDRGLQRRRASASCRSGTDLESSRWSAEAAASRAARARGRRAPPERGAGVRSRRPAARRRARGDRRARRAAARARDRRDRARLLPHRGGRVAPRSSASFEAHIELAKKHGIALQIHDRDAHDDVLETLERVGAPERTVFHCFSRRRRDGADRAPTRAGTCRSPATVTFKNAENLREALAVDPARRASWSRRMRRSSRPMPLRGRPNAPYLIPHTLRRDGRRTSAPTSSSSPRRSRRTPSWSTAAGTTSPCEAPRPEP